MSGRRWPRWLFAPALAVALVVPAQLPEPALAASTVQQARSSMWSGYSAAWSDYRAATTTYRPLPITDVKQFGAASVRGRASLSKVKPLIAKANTASSLSAAQTALARERKRASVMRSAAVLESMALKARTTVRTRLLKDHAAHLAGRISDALWTASANAAAAVSTRVEADRRASVHAAGTLVPPVSHYSVAAANSYAAGHFTQVSMAGWTGVPGGCALPTVDRTRWLGRATDPGPHLWLSPDWEASMPTATTGPFADAASTVRRAGQQEAARTYAWTSTLPATHMPRRSLALSVAWRQFGNTTARSRLLSDVHTIIRNGPKDLALRNAMTLEAAATSIDLVGPDAALRSELNERLMVDWLAPLSCMLADRDPMLTVGNNGTEILDTATVFGSVVTAPDFPGASAALIAAAVKSTTPALSVIAGDGGSPEGPSYWSFEGRYIAALYATMSSLYGSTPPAALPNMWRTLNYWRDSTDPRGTTFTYGDSTGNPLIPYIPSWVGFSTGNALGGEATVQRAAKAPEAWTLWWWPRSATNRVQQSQLFSRAGFAVLHGGSATGWLKGGTNTGVHTHLDLGSFAYQQQGLMWSIDPGAEPYGPMYFRTPQRWSFWKTQTRAHSTIRRAGTINQSPSAYAQFVGFSSAGRTATVDLRRALGVSGVAKRTLTLGSNGSMRVTDSIRATSARGYTWNWTTDAAVRVSGRTFTLVKSGHSLKVTLWGLPRGTTIRVVAAPSGKKSVEGRSIRIVEVTVPAVRNLTLTATAG